MGGWLVAVALAGCVAGPAPADGLPGDVDLAARLPSKLFGTPVVVGPGTGETSLAIGRDGTMLACIHGSFAGPSPSWVSVDGGATFKALVPAPNPIRAGDCDVAVTDDGAWAIVYDTLYSSSVAVTRDQGRSWILNHVAALPIGGVDRPWIEADGKDLVMFYQDVAAAEPDLDMFARSTDGGATWIDQRLVNRGEPPNKIQGVLGDLFFGPGRATMHGAMLRYWMPTAVPTGDYRSPPKYLELATSSDRGATWSVRPVRGPIAGPLQFPTATAAGDGTFYFSFALTNGTGDDVYVMHSTDAGRTWSEPVRLASNVYFANTVSTTWIEGGSDGGATLAWLGNERANATSRGTSQLMVARVHAGHEPFVDFVGPVGATGNAAQGAEFIMVRFDHDGKAHVLYPMSGGECGEARCILLASEV